MLCRPCKSALKRARHATVQDFPGTPPMVTMPAGLFPPPQARAGPSRSRRVEADKETARRMVLALLALALLAAAAYVGRRGMREDDAVPAHVTPVVAAPKAAPAVPAAAPVPEPPPRVSIAEPAPVVRASSPVRTAAAKPATSASRAPTPPIPAPPVAPPHETVAAVAEAPPVVPLPRTPPPTDRWQSMADALARCANEGGLSGFICGQRVRIESCDGYWGRVAQCANRPEAQP